jgi:IPT/TIG domain-containing protein/List-Bact-rpt repeat protein
MAPRWSTGRDSRTDHTATKGEMVSEGMSSNVFAGKRRRMSLVRGGSLAVLLALSIVLGISLVAQAASSRTELPALSHEGIFNRACGVATDSAGNLYVANRATSAVKIYSPTGAFIKEFTALFACALAVDSSGEVYSIASTTGQVAKTKSSEFPPTSATTFMGDGAIVSSNATAVAIDPATQHPVVAEAIKEKQTVSVADATGGTFTLSFEGSAPTVPINFNEAANGVKTKLEALSTIGANVTVAVAGTNPKVYTVTFQGKFTGLNVGQLSCDGSALTGTVTPSCTTATTTQGESRISTYESNGTLLNGTIGSGVSGAVYTGVDVYGATGRIYAADKAHNKAYVFNPAGNTVLSEIDGHEAPSGAFSGMEQAAVAVDQSNGNVLVSDIKGHGVVDEFNVGGRYIDQLSHTPAALTEAEPADIAVDNSSTANKGTVYVSSGFAATASVYAYAPLSPTPKLSVTKSGTGTGTVTSSVAVSSPPGSITDSNIVCGSICEHEYAEGEVVTLTPTPDSGSAFQEWTGACSGSGSCIVTMSAAKTVNAVFGAAGEALTIATNGTGTGTVECEVNSGPAEPCAATYPNGTNVKLKVTPAPGAEFGGFSGDCTGPGPCELTMTAPKSVTATFNLIGQKTFTVSTEGTGSGSIECNSGSGFGSCAAGYPENTIVTLKAIPDGNSVFKGWTVTGSGSTTTPCTGTTSPCEVKVSNDVTVSADFGAITVTAVAPSSGTTAGGTAVTITGTNLTGATEVKYGATAVTCTGVVATCKVESATEIKATTPAHAAGAVDVRVVTAGGESAVNSPADQFTFVTPPAAPAVTAVAPSSGTTAGGTAVTITGTNLTGATEVKYGATAVTCTGVVATCKVESATEIKATTPAHAAGAVDVKVTTSGGTSATSAGDVFTFVASPTVASINPHQGPTAGGTAVTITGTNLTGATEVKFGANDATGVSIVSATQITATSPAGAAGIVDVTVGTAGGTSATGAGGKFTYIAPHTLTINRSGSGSGSVTCNGGSCLSSYPDGTKVTLAASAAAGSSFAGWAGAGCSGTGACEIVLSADTTVTATFNTTPSAGNPPIEETGTPTVSRTALVSGGKAALIVTCKGANVCKGTLKLTAKIKRGKKTKNVVIGRASYSVAAGKPETIKVKLSGAAKQELAKGKTIKAKLSGGLKGTVKLKLAKKK